MRTSRNMTFFLPDYQPVTKIFVILYMATSYNILVLCVSLALSCAAGYYQNGKRKTTPVNGNDFLYHIKMFLPFIQIGMFIFSAVLFGGPHQTHDTSRNIGALNAENSYKANGLYGHVSDLFFVDENTGHVDFCHVTSSVHIL